VLSDVFDLQERITRQVVASMVPELEAEEMRQSERGGRRYSEADDMAWRAARSMAEGMFGGPSAQTLEAITLAEQAVARDRQCALAWYVLSNSHAWRVFMAWATDRASSVAASRQAADMLMAVAPSDSRSYFQRGLAKEMAGEHSGAVADLRRACELNPNDATAMFFLSYIEAAEGNTARAKALAGQALRMSPKDRWVSTAYLAQALCAFLERDWQGTHDWADLAIQAQATHPIRRVLMIAFAGEVGDEPLLRKHFSRLQAVAPQFVDTLFSGEYRPLHRPEHMQMLLASLRKAGLGH
jgi:tetratricopeptide (TPR) repeat protein